MIKATKDEKIFVIIILDSSMGFFITLKEENEANPELSILMD